MNLSASRQGENARQSLTAPDWVPAVDISEDANEYLIKADLPEINKDDVKVSVENGVLTFKGERRFENEEHETKYHRRERSYGSFLRGFAIPEDADPEKVSAEFKDGLLVIRLPKSEAEKPKLIQVQVN